MQETMVAHIPAVAERRLSTIDDAITLERGKNDVTARRRPT